MRGADILAEHYPLVQEAVLLRFGKRGKARKRMDPRLLDEREEIARARIIPPDERKPRALRIADCVACKARIGHEPTFIHARRGFGCVAEVFVARMRSEERRVGKEC